MISSILAEEIIAEFGKLNTPKLDIQTVDDDVYFRLRMPYKDKIIGLYEISESALPDVTANYIANKLFMGIGDLMAMSSREHRFCQKRLIKFLAKLFGCKF